MKFLLPLPLAFAAASSLVAAEPVVFNARTAGSGVWSAAATWAGGRVPKAGDFVQVRAGHTVHYDVQSRDVLRMVHVAGTLTFSREKSTLLEVGLLRIEPGESTTEEGFNCHGAEPIRREGEPRPVLEIGTREKPIPAGVTATIRLRHFPGTDPDTLPAIVACGGRWDIHGAPMSRTWLRLEETAPAGQAHLGLAEPPGGWCVGDRIIVTSSEPNRGPESGHTFEAKSDRRQKQRPVGTEVHRIKAIDGKRLTLEKPLTHAHLVEDAFGCVAANLSRNVVVESADPAGVRGHTMYHRGSSGGISYAEFRHLGKEGVLGKYAIHFHLVRDTFRGSGVVGASIWDSHNRWVTVHGTDYLLIRDCVGYQSRGHGFFLEDATEQWNVFDRNLAVQAFGSRPLPDQVLPYDPNDGAGFWWANGRNAFTRNVSCENDHYGYHFHLAKTPEFDPVLRLRGPGGIPAPRDVRTIPFLRFEDNESHGDGLFGFRFGDEKHGSVRGDRTHPFAAANLKAWNAHFAVRPNVAFFLLDGLQVKRAAYGIYHPEPDVHAYRDVALDSIAAEPLNGGHDETSVPKGNFTFDRLTFRNCNLRRDPLIQLTQRAERTGLECHFRDVKVVASRSEKGTVAFGGGPRTNKTDNPIGYYFHNAPQTGEVLRVVHVKNGSGEMSDWTGSDARAEAVKGVAFPDLLAPVDDLPPASMILSVARDQGKRTLRGIAVDNGTIAGISVNGKPATILSRHAGVADWVIMLDADSRGGYTSEASDRAGNVELQRHESRNGE